MVKTTLKVDGMSCEHCVNAITKAVSSLVGVQYIIVYLKACAVEVDFDSNLISLEDIKQEIENQGYDVA